MLQGEVVAKMLINCLLMDLMWGLSACGMLFHSIIKISQTLLNSPLSLVTCKVLSEYANKETSADSKWQKVCGMCYCFNGIFIKNYFFIHNGNFYDGNKRDPTRSFIWCDEKVIISNVKFLSLSTTSSLWAGINLYAAVNARHKIMMRRNFFHCKNRNLCILWRGQALKNNNLETAQK
jgi:hypothetical protein